jgi:hypothetical protein
MSREGRVPRLVKPDAMVPPLLSVVSREADNVNGCRFDANFWTRHCPRRSRAKRRPHRRLRNASAANLT